MVAVREITWEEASAPGFEQTTRQAWRAAVAEIAERAKATLPDCAGRVDAAVKLVLAGDVELLPDGKAQVASQSNGTTTYRVVNGECTCKDYPKAPSNWCKHRIAAGLQKRAAALVQRKLDAGANGQAEAPTQPAPPAQPDASPAALPEAPVSITLKASLHGHEVLVTLRGTDFASVKAQVEQASEWLKVQTPAPSGPTADDTPQCPTHGAMKKSTKGRGWYCSGKLPNGDWCPQRRR
jgi:hypothetical protein